LPQAFSPVRRPLPQSRSPGEYFEAVWRIEVLTRDQKVSPDMACFDDFWPSHYCVDERERRVLIGLTIKETLEFQALDALPPLDSSGTRLAWSAQGAPLTPREKRWLQLYLKHDAALKLWMIGSRANRSAHSNLAN
jgi:hypothetical protein